MNRCNSIDEAKKYFDKVNSDLKQGVEHIIVDDHEHILCGTNYAYDGIIYTCAMELVRYLKLKDRVDICDLSERLLDALDQFLDEENMVITDVRDNY